jgi:ABC-type molybdate transport system ATPase subunit
VSVTAPDGCAWTAVSNVSWITILSGASGSGNGTVSYSVASTTRARSGTMTIAGQTLTVRLKRR